MDTVVQQEISADGAMGQAFDAEVCVIGAGAAGLAAGKALADRGIAFDWFEKGSMVGGLWRIDNDNGGVAAYKTLHLNSSRTADPVPLLPDARGLARLPVPRADRVGTSRASPRTTTCWSGSRSAPRSPAWSRCPVTGPPGGHGWAVTAADGRRRTYRAVMVANGHHGAPKHPRLPRASSPARRCTPTTTATPPIFTDKDVVVVGVGQLRAWTSPATRPRSRTGCTW